MKASRGPRDRDLGDRPAAVAITELNVSFLEFYEPLHDRQSQSGSIHASGEEGFEDTVPDLRRNPRATVVNPDPADTVARGNVDFDMLVGRGLAGVEGEVQQCRAKHVRVGARLEVEI